MHTHRPRVSADHCSGARARRYAVLGSIQPAVAQQMQVGTAAMTIAAAQLGAIAAASAQAPKPSITSAGKTGMHTSFKSLKQVNAGLLNVGYAEDGPADGPPVLLLHGWPYDIHSFVDVAPLLAAMPSERVRARLLRFAVANLQ